MFRYTLAIYTSSGIHQQWLLQRMPRWEVSENTDEVVSAQVVGEGQSVGMFRIVCGVESTPIRPCLNDTFSAQARRLTLLTA